MSSYDKHSGGGMVIGADFAVIRPEQQSSRVHTLGQRLKNLKLRYVTEELKKVIKAGKMLTLGQQKYSVRTLKKKKIGEGWITLDSVAAFFSVEKTTQAAFSESAFNLFTASSPRSVCW